MITACGAWTCWAASAACCLRCARRLRDTLGVGDDDGISCRVEKQRTTRGPAGKCGLGLAELRALGGAEVEHEEVLVLAVDRVDSVWRNREHGHLTA